jgi:hypothetical protein
MTLTTPAERGASRYRAALLDVCQKLEVRQPFALARFGEGEIAVLQNQWFDDTEYSNDPQDPSSSAPIAGLMASFRYKHPSYFVGIPCPHCAPLDFFGWAVKESGQDVAQLTFACLFCNSNYPFFLSEAMPLFREYEVILVCNQAANITGLPFNVSKDFRIGRNAWRDDLAIIHELKTYIDTRSPAGLLVLFAAGPLSNIAIHELHCHCPSNTYLDIGSALDSYFYGNRRVLRGYLSGSVDLQDSCDWTPADFAALSSEKGGLAVDVPQRCIGSLDRSALEMWSKITDLLKSSCLRFNEEGGGVGRPRIFYSEDRVEKPDVGLTCLGSRLLRLFLEGDHLQSGKSDIPSNQGIVIRQARDQGDKFVIERDAQTSVVTLTELGSYLLSPVFDYVETAHEPVRRRR